MKASRVARASILLAAFGLVLAACGSDDGASDVPLEDQSIVFGNFGAYTPEGFLEDFTAATGVEVTISEYVDNEDLLGKLQAADGTGFDVLMVTGNYIQTLVDNGWLVELDHEQLPNLENLYPEATQLAFDPGNVYSVPTRGARPASATEPTW